MKLKHIICNLGQLAMLSFVSSCGDFFDEVPSRGDNEVLNRGEQVRNLFANSSNYYTPVDFLVASTDDYGIKKKKNKQTYEQVIAFSQNHSQTVHRKNIIPQKL